MIVISPSFLVTISLHILFVSSQIQFDLNKRYFNNNYQVKQDKLHKRDLSDSSSSYNIGFIDDTIAYYVNISVGSENQHIVALLDTGSSDLWFPGPENSKCTNGSPNGERFEDSPDFPQNISPSTKEELKDLAKKVQNYCSSTSAFNYHKSDTWNSNNTDFEISYLDGSKSTGIWGTDSIEVGGLKFNNFSFAVTNNSNASAILGIGVTKSETTYLKSQSYTYANFPQRLKNDGYIDKVTYSLSSGNQDRSEYEGVLLVGGVDHSKYAGVLTTLPMLSDSRISVTLSALGLKTNGSSIITASSTFYETLLDSGTTTANFPEQLLLTTAKKLGSTLTKYNRDSYEYYDVDCSYLSNTDATFELDFSGKIISVPLMNAITKQDDICLLKIVSLTNDIIILGDIFLSSMYIVYDLEDKEVALAQVNPDPTIEEKNVEPIITSIPSATKAPNYSSTYSTQLKETTTHDVFSTILI